jgi:uncharacterized protein (DUF1778 family)
MHRRSTHTMAMPRATLSIRISEDERTMLRVAASVADSSVSEFARRASLEAAHNVLADRRRFVVDDAAWLDYQRELDAPAEVRSELVTLFARPDLFD